MSKLIIRLDRMGDAPVPVGYKLVETEVDFLRLAPEGHPLMVRGDRLCDWARNFYNGRRITVREAQSPTREIQTAVPSMSEEDAGELYKRIGSDPFANLERPLQPAHLLEALYPMRMWLDEPSLSHAAEWLVWLYGQQPDPIIQNLFAPILDRWRANANEPERLVYQAADGKTAHQYLWAWLQIEPQPSFADLGQFPGNIPSGLVSEARGVWAQSIIESQGAFFEDIERRSIPGALRRVAAAETAAYFMQNPGHLTHKHYKRLARFLSSKQQEELTAFLPPALPAELPTSAEEILVWFESEYLPFRLWQTRHGDAQAADTAERAARRFAEWYLAEYPKGLMGGPLHTYLSFNQAGNSSFAKSTLTRRYFPG